MPTYIYETIPVSAHETSECFEIKQSINDTPLTHHPETNKPIRRVLIAGHPLTKADDSGDCCCGPSGCCG